jgi:hypothetical protein
MRTTAQWVTDPDLDITDLSVGFDLRLHPEMQVFIPRLTRSVRYTDPETRESRMVRGAMSHITRALRVAGYRPCITD